MSCEQSNPLKAKVSHDHPFFEIIEDAYDVFARPKPDRIEVCENCCMYAHVERDFFNPSIRELPLDYLQDWFFAACDPEGISQAMWGYLLPRILEVLAVDEDVARIAHEISLRRFDTGNRDNWSSAEWQVLDRFQRAYLAREVRRDTEFLDDTICMFALAGWPMDSLLGQVASFSDAELAQRFWRDWCSWSLPGRESIWITPFWDEPNGSTALKFYTSQTLYDRMERLALHDDTDPDIAAKASAVARVLEGAGSPPS